MRKFSRRQKIVLVVAAVVTVAVNGGFAWAYWTISGSASTSAVAGTAMELEVSAAVYPSQALVPGSRAPLRVKIKNTNSFPIRVTLVKPGPGAVTIDAAHRSAGCLTSGVSIANPVYSVIWPVAKNSTAEYVLPDAVKMTNESDSACQGATFGVPTRLSGISAS